MKNIEFRPVSPDDHVFICGVYNYYVETSTATYDTEPVKEDSAAEVFGFYREGTSAYVIEESDSRIGFCLLKPFNSSKKGFSLTAEISVYLENSFTGRGIGVRALSFLETRAAGAGLKVIIAAVCSENSESIRLFSENGYVRCGLFRSVGYKFSRFLDNVYLQKFL